MATRPENNMLQFWNRSKLQSFFDYAFIEQPNRRYNCMAFSQFFPLENKTQMHLKIWQKKEKKKIAFNALKQLSLCYSCDTQLSFDCDDDSESWIENTAHRKTNVLALWSPESKLNFADLTEFSFNDPSMNGSDGDLRWPFSLCSTEHHMNV